MGALDSIRVIELGAGMAPAIVGMFMSDAGADVRKVEPPGGNPHRGDPGFATWNRGKKSLALDPCADANRAWLASSIAGADILVVPTESDLQGWGDDVRFAVANNARLVVVSMPPYLPEGTPWIGGEESNALLSAHCSVSWRQASVDGAPVEPVYPHLLYVHGLWAAVCAVAALVERERSGYGQSVTV